MERHGLDSLRLALRIVTLGVGVFFLGTSLEKIEWLASPDILAQRFQRYLQNPSFFARVYLESVAIPGVAVFARLVPVAEFCTALAMLTGVLRRFAALAAIFMIVNFGIARGVFSSWNLLSDATGLPMLTTLSAVVIGGRHLPYVLGSEALCPKMYRKNIKL